MAATCSQCSRPNPADARYCYFDGAALAVGAGGPVNVARQDFPAPFISPSGQQCRNFDELAIVCERNWAETADLLQRGYLQKFLTALGRSDLARAADEAAKFPDRDRGIDQFLARLPSRVLAAPKLQVRPQQLHLGQLTVGRDQRFELELDNAGDRLIFGTVASDCAWLSAGDGPAGEARLVQFTTAQKMMVLVSGRHLRAGTRTLEGSLVVETNAGSATVRVTADVPIQPFPEGALAGAKSPREVAERAKKAPKDAAPLFQSGAVARWYAANGWTYPVEGPSASGLGAVQQFFEALGLTKPPKVTVSETAIRLRGAPGAKLLHAVRVQTAEGRPVYAHGKGNVAWVTARPAQLKGAEATVTVEVTVPDCPGETARATLHLQANGNQRFAIPIQVKVEAASRVPAAVTPPVAVTPPAPRAAAPAPRSAAPASSHAALALHLVPVALLMLPLLGLVAADFLRDIPRPRLLNVQEELPPEKEQLAQNAAFKVAIQDEPDETTFGPVKFQIEDVPEERAPNVETAPVKVEIKDEPTESAPQGMAAVEQRPLVTFQVARPPHQFGVSATEAAGKARLKQLTFDRRGGTNTTVVRINGDSAMLGDFRGRWLRTDEPALIPAVAETPGASRRSLSTWSVGGTPAGTGGLQFHQVLEVVPGQPVTVGGVSRRLLDTVLVRWVIVNQDKRAHRVGLRLQLDTLIGGNDGVPFTVPNYPGLVSTFADYRQPQEVPDFIQALEFANLQNPGTVAQLNAKVGGGIEPPGRLALTHWPGGNLAWDIPVLNLGGDSAVILYWPDQALQPGGKRVIGFSYGLGNVSASDKLGLTLGGSFEPGQNFTATAYVDNPVAGQTLRLELPAGLRRLEGAETQRVPTPAPGGRNFALVTWKVQVERTGDYRLAVHSSTGLSQAKLLSIGRAAPTGGRFTLHLDGSFEPGQPFDVRADVTEPAAGQTLTLDLPDGLKRVGDNPTQPVPAAAGGAKSVVAWKATVVRPGKHTVRVVSSTGLTQAKTVTIAATGRDASNFRIALDGDFAPGKLFDVTARVTDPAPGQTLTLQLPAGLQLAGGAEKQAVPSGTSAALTWKVKVLQEGKFPVRVASSTGVTQRKNLVIEPPNQAGRFTFDLVGEIRPGREFTVRAQVAEPVAGQKLTLALPDGLRLIDDPAVQPVPGGGAVTWRVQVARGGRLPVRVESSTGLVRAKTITLTEIGSSTLFGQ